MCPEGLTVVLDVTKVMQYSEQRLNDEERDNAGAKKGMRIGVDLASWHSLA